MPNGFTNFYPPYTASAMWNDFFELAFVPADDLQALVAEVGSNSTRSEQLKGFEDASQIFCCKYKRLTLESALAFAELQHFLTSNLPPPRAATQIAIYC